MNHIYTVTPVKHQPQWPVNDNKPEPSHPSRIVAVIGYCMFGLLFVAICALGLFSMTVAP